MELRDYIEAGFIKKTGRDALSSYLGISPNSLTDAKAHRRGLPADACVKLATLLDIDPITVIAASELATERKEDKRSFWLPFVTKAGEMAKAASYALILGLVTNFVTPTPAEAKQIQEMTGETICIM